MAGATFSQAVTIGGEVSAAPHNDAWDNLEDYINDRLADGTSGQLIVCDSSGNPRPVSASGDVSAISSAGAVTLAAGAIDPLQLNTEIFNDHQLIFQATGTFTGQILGSAVAGPIGFQEQTTAVDSEDMAMKLFAYDNDWHDLTGKFTDLVIRAVVVCRGRMQTTGKIGLYEKTTVATNPLQADLVAGSELAVSNVADDSVTTPTGVQFDEPSDGAYGLGFYFDGTTHTNTDIDIHAQVFKRRSNS